MNNWRRLLLGGGEGGSAGAHAVMTMPDHRPLWEQASPGCRWPVQRPVPPLSAPDALAHFSNCTALQASAEAVAAHGAFTIALAGGSLVKALAGLAGRSDVDFSMW